MSSQRCPSCQRSVSGDVRFCGCRDQSVLGLAPMRASYRRHPSNRPGPAAELDPPPSAMLQGAVIVGFQIALLLLIQPLWGS